MIIPPEKDLDSFASDLVSRCMSTRRERIGAYSGLKHYFLFGSQEGDQAPFNKIFPHIDLLTSFLYSQSTVEYDIGVQNKPDLVFQQARLISGRTNTLFHDQGVADMFAEALTWALVFNSTFLKLNWEGGIEPYMIEPHNFGVLREDVPLLERQEAFTHAYTISRDELQRRIMGLPNAADIMRRVQAAPVQDEDAFPEAINRLIVAGTVDMTSTTTRGLVNVPDLLGQLQYKPRTNEDLVEMYELWVWDDKKEDYRTITLAAPGVVIYGREKIGNLFGIKGEHPFIHICPNRLYDYFFGWSEITMLLKLQDWMTTRLREIKTILTKQARPPKAFSGWGGISDEKFGAMDNPGAWMSDPTPNAKVDILAPDLPNDMWVDIRNIADMFNDESGLSDVLQGKGESGVRTKGQADILARLGSARIKKRALSVERTLEEIGDVIVMLMKAKDPHQFKLQDGNPFFARQFTDEYQVHVDAHSASPVFVDDHVQLLFGLNKAGALSPADLIRGTKPPRTEELVQNYEKMASEKALQEQQQMALGLVTGGKKPQPRAA